MKGTLTILGDADPYDIIVRIRKAGKHAEIVSIGPPPGPAPLPPGPAPPKTDAAKKPAENKKPEEKSKPGDKDKPSPVSLDQISYVLYTQMPYCYPQYQGQPVAVVYMNRWDEPNTSCTIM